MAYSYVTPTANGVTTQFSVPFDYLRKAHVQCTVDGVQKDITWVNDTLIQLAVAPAAGSLVIVKRVTPQAEPLVNFADGSTLVADDLDAANLQLLYISQEIQDFNDNQTVLGPNYMLRWQLTATAGQTALTGADDTSQTLSYQAGLEQVFKNGILLRLGIEYTATNGTLITLATGATAGDKIQVLAQRQYSVAEFPGSNLTDDSITSAKLAAGAVTLAKMADNSVNSAKIVDGSIVNADVNASAAIAGTKVTPSFGDQNIQTNQNLLVGGTATITGAISTSASISGAGLSGSALAITGSGAFGETVTIDQELHFNDDDDSNYVGFRAPTTVAANLVWTLPAVDGSATQRLTTDGAGNLSWASESAAIPDHAYNLVTGIF
jgi:hypothetical protein